MLCVMTIISLIDDLVGWVVCTRAQWDHDHEHTLVGTYHDSQLPAKQKENKENNDMAG